MPIPVLKEKSSFQRLKQRIGLDRERKLPPRPVPPLPATAVAADPPAARAQLEENARQSSSSRSGEPVRKGAVKPASLDYPLPPNAPFQMQANSSAPALPLPPSEDTPPPAMTKKRSTFMRMAKRFRPNHDHEVAAEPTTHRQAALERAQKPAHRLTLKAPQPHLPDDPKTRRDQALRARGLLPASKTKYLSQIEAEENQRVGVVELPRSSDVEGPTEAAALIDTWRARNTPSPSESADYRTNLPTIPASPLSPHHITPPISPRLQENPASPRSSRTRKSEDGSAPPNSTEKVTQWLQRSPTQPKSPRQRDSAEERMVTFSMPRAPGTATPKASSAGRASAESMSAETKARTGATLTETAAGADGLAKISAPNITQTAADKEGPHLVLPPSPIVASSSSETSCSATMEPITPSSASHSLRTRGLSAARGVPAGITPIIVETAEEGILRDERAIVATTPEEKSSFGKDLPTVPESAPAAPVVEATSTLRPPGRGKGERRSFGFFFSKPVRSATLQPEKKPLGMAKSAGDLKRGATMPLVVPASPRSPATPLAPTMHSSASIVNGVQFIDDEESRRLSELAFVC